MVRHRVSSLDSRGPDASAGSVFARRRSVVAGPPHVQHGRVRPRRTDQRRLLLAGGPCDLRLARRARRHTGKIRPAHPSRRSRAAHRGRHPRPRPRGRRPLQPGVPHRPRRRRDPLGEHPRADLLRGQRPRAVRGPRHRRHHRRHRHEGCRRAAAGSRGPAAPRRDAGPHGSLHARQRRRRRRVVGRQQGPVRVQPRVEPVARRALLPPAPRRRAPPARGVRPGGGRRRRVRDRVPRAAACRRRGDAFTRSSSARGTPSRAAYDSSAPTST